MLTRPLAAILAQGLQTKPQGLGEMRPLGFWLKEAGSLIFVGKLLI